MFRRRTAEAGEEQPRRRNQKLLIENEESETNALDLIHE